jgi:hypothetical protein
MFRLGVRNEKIGASRPWHASDFMIDEESMKYGTYLMVASVLDFLNG